MLLYGVVNLWYPNNFLRLSDSQRVNQFAEYARLINLEPFIEENVALNLLLDVVLHVDNSVHFYEKCKPIAVKLSTYFLINLKKDVIGHLWNAFVAVLLKNELWPIYDIG